MDLDEQLALRFVCAKCKKRGGLVKRFAATGTGLTRFIDVKHTRFVAVSCKNCGFTELYNPEILEGKSKTGDILDYLFGG